MLDPASVEMGDDTDIDYLFIEFAAVVNDPTALAFHNGRLYVANLNGNLYSYTLSEDLVLSDEMEWDLKADLILGESSGRVAGVGRESPVYLSNCEHFITKRLLHNHTKASPQSLVNVIASSIFRLCCLATVGVKQPHLSIYLYLTKQFLAFLLSSYTHLKLHFPIRHCH